MARTIGKINIKRVKNTTLEVLVAGTQYEGAVREEVRDRLPERMWDTWESADSEIDRIIHDTIFSTPESEIVQLQGRA